MFSDLNNDQKESYEFLEDLNENLENKICNLLSSNLQSSNRIITKLDRLLSNSSDPEKFFKQLNEKGKLFRGVCSTSWRTSNTIIYRCITCQKHPTSCICYDCFHNGNHEGHLYFTRVSGAGCCDCGNEDSWKPSGFCKHHKGPPKNPEILLEESYRDRLTTIIPLLLKQIIFRLSNEKIKICKGNNGEGEEINWSITIEPIPIIKWINKICQICNGSLRIVGECFYKQKHENKTILDYFIRVSLQTEKKLLKSIKNLYYLLLVDQPFKYEYTKSYIKIYHEMKYRVVTNAEANGNELCEFSVQLFTSTRVIKEHCHELNSLKIILQTFYDCYSSSLINDPIFLTLNFENKMIKNKTINQISSDLGYLFHSEYISKYLLLKNKTLLKLFLDVLSIVTGMNQIKRNSKEVTTFQEDNNYLTCYSLEYDFYPLFELLSRFLDGTDTNKINFSKKEQLINKIKIMINLLLNSIWDWCEKNHLNYNDLVETTVTISKSLEEINDFKKNILIYNYDINKDYISTHYTLHRFLATILQTIIRKFPNLNIFEIFQNDLTFNNDENKHFKNELLKIFIHIMRLRSFSTQVYAGLWVRNGVSIITQLKLQNHPKFCLQRIDLDIYLLQIATITLDTDTFLINFLKTFNLMDYLIISNNDTNDENEFNNNNLNSNNNLNITTNTNTNNNNLNNFDNDVIFNFNFNAIDDIINNFNEQNHLENEENEKIRLNSQIMAQFLKLIIIILIDRKNLNNYSKKKILKNEIIHYLFYKELSFSKIFKLIAGNITEKKNDTNLIQNILLKVSTQTNKNKFQIKSKYWKKFKGNYFYHYFLDQHQKALENYYTHLRNFNKKNNQKLPIKPPLPKYIQPTNCLHNLSTLIHNHLISKIIFILLYKIVVIKEVYVTELCDFLFHLIYLILITPNNNDLNSQNKKNSMDKNEKQNDNTKINHNKDRENDNEIKTKTTASTSTSTSTSCPNSEQIEIEFEKIEKNDKIDKKIKDQVYNNFIDDNITILNLRFPTNSNFLKNACFNILTERGIFNIITLLLVFLNNTTINEHKHTIKQILKFFSEKDTNCKQIISKFYDDMFKIEDQKRIKERKRRKALERQKRIMKQMNDKQNKLLLKFETQLSNSNTPIKTTNNLNEHDVVKSDINNKNPNTKEKNTDTNIGIENKKYKEKEIHKMGGKGISKKEEEEKEKEKEKEKTLKNEKCTSILDNDFINLNYSKNISLIECSMCREIQKSKPIFLMSYLQKSSKILPNKYVLTGCSHSIHYDCYQNYHSTLLKRKYSERIFEGYRSTVPEYGELLCPLDRKIINVIIPCISNKYFNSNNNIQKKDNNLNNNTTTTTITTNSDNEQKNESENEKMNEDIIEENISNNNELEIKTEIEIENEKVKEEKNGENERERENEKKEKKNNEKKNEEIIEENISKNNELEIKTEIEIENEKEKVKVNKEEKNEKKKKQEMIVIQKKNKKKTSKCFDNEKKQEVENKNNENLNIFTNNNLQGSIEKLKLTIKNETINCKFKENFELQKALNVLASRIYKMKYSRILENHGNNIIEFQLIVDLLTDQIQDLELCSRNLDLCTPFNQMQYFQIQSLFRICLLSGTHSKKKIKKRNKLKKKLIEYLANHFNFNDNDSTSNFEFISYDSVQTLLLSIFIQLLCLININFPTIFNFFNLAKIIYSVFTFRLLYFLGYDQKKKLGKKEKLKLKAYSKPFLRQLYITYNYCIIQDNSGKKLNLHIYQDFKKLCLFLKLSPKFNTILKCDNLKKYFKIKNSSILAKFVKINRYKKLKFFKLPNCFQTLWYQSLISDDEKKDINSQNQAICLISGDIIIFQNSIVHKTRNSSANDNDNDGIGDKYFTIQEHFNKFGMRPYLVVKGKYSSSIITYRNGIGVVQLKSCYCDKWKETDVGLVRGKDLLLDKTRLNQVYAEYLTNSLIFSMTRVLEK
ncbi:ubiquitin ligase e3 alpha-related [Anaeramoeba flamelloides]|uniref:E3 ubiquitin-protein ligase n=1 Tax=Anaeramoeba flamelloides TaxID=1746091 RepID=A0AAV8A6R8_9EUKA|nr:ubiquitin ligase e3 alpha-related [Anaeramoeba flamelloides]